MPSRDLAALTIFGMLVGGSALACGTTGAGVARKPGPRDAAVWEEVSGGRVRLRLRADDPNTLSFNINRVGCEGATKVAVIASPRAAPKDLPVSGGDFSLSVEDVLAAGAADPEADGRIALQWDVCRPDWNRKVNGITVTRAHAPKFFEALGTSVQQKREDDRRAQVQVDEERRRRVDAEVAEQAKERAAAQQREADAKAERIAKSSTLAADRRKNLEEARKLLSACKLPIRLDATRIGLTDAHVLEGHGAPIAVFNADATAPSDALLITDYAKGISYGREPVIVGDYAVFERETFLLDEERNVVGWSYYVGTTPEGRRTIDEAFPGLAKTSWDEVLLPEMLETGEPKAFAIRRCGPLILTLQGFCYARAGVDRQTYAKVYSPPRSLGECTFAALGVVFDYATTRGEVQWPPLTFPLR